MDIDGQWTGTIETSASLGEFQLDLHSDDTGALDGEVAFGPGRGDVHGSIRDDRLEFVTQTSGLTGSLPLTFRGIAQGDSILGEVEIGNYERALWTATRSPAQAGGDGVDDSEAAYLDPEPGTLSCLHCGSTYRVERNANAMADRNALDCDVCGRPLLRWREPVTYDVTLMRPTR